MKELLIQRLLQLLCVKSIMTLMLTVVFTVLVLYDKVNQDFMTIYSVVVAFYFGSQLQQNAITPGKEKSNGTH